MEQQDEAGATAGSHLIITVHGIRTYGQWQERLEQMVRDYAPDRAIEFINYKIGYFSLVKFILPPYRWFVVRRFRNELIKLCTQARWDRIDLVSHSFGTHVVGHAIRRLPEGIRINTVILAGSVLKADFPWRDLIGKKVSRVVNDCGHNDKVLLLSNIGSLFTGMAGRTGFSGATGIDFRNRYSLIGHSGYFQDRLGKSDNGYMNSHWVSLLRSDRPIDPFDLRTPRWSDTIVSVLETNGVLFKLVLYALPFVLLFFIYLHLYQRAEQNFTAAKNTVDGVIENITEGLQGVAGMRVETVRKILDTVENSTDTLKLTAPNDPELLRIRAAMFTHFAATYLQYGDPEFAEAAAQQSVDINSELATKYPGNRFSHFVVTYFAKFAATHPSNRFSHFVVVYFAKLAQTQRDLSVSQNWLGEAKLRLGKSAEAVPLFRESLDIRRKLAAQDPNDAHAQRDVKVSLDYLGEAQLQTGDQPGALATYRESIDIAQKLADQHKSNAEAQRDLSMSLNHLGDAKLQSNDRAGALAAFQKSVDIAQKLADQDTNSAEAQHDLALSLLRLGEATLQDGDRAGALVALHKGFGFLVTLAAQDPSNVQVLRALAVGLYDLSIMAQTTQTRADLTKSLSILDTETQRRLSVFLIQRGDVQLQKGDQAGAFAAYQANLALVERLAQSDPGNADWQRNLIVSCVKVAGVDPSQARVLLTRAAEVAISMRAKGILAPKDAWMPDYLARRIASLPQ